MKSAQETNISRTMTFQMIMINNDVCCCRNRNTDTNFAEIYCFA